MNNGPSRKITPSLFGAIMAGFLASACCLGPFVVLLLGIGSVSAFISLEPYRPFFAVITFGLLGWSIWQYWSNRKRCLDGDCISTSKALGLWLLGGFALLMLFSPSIIPLFYWGEFT